MRGKVQLVIFAGVVHGITPAYAGKSASWYDEECSKEDHPRLCGEKGNYYSHLKNIVGSPPPMRGKD